MTYGDEAGGGRPCPALVPYVLPQRPHAAVLVLHGGRAEGLEPPPALNLPGARMRPFVRAIGRATAGHGVVLAGVRYRHRGWNGEREDAARDALRALEALRQRAGEVPVMLVGHSMGGRAAGAQACHLVVPGGDHAMLRGAGTWHALTARLVAGLLRLGPLPPEVAGAMTAPVSEGAR